MLKKIRNNFFKNRATRGSLRSQLILGAKGDQGETGDLDTPVNLTSLVDAFSILVIYLLVNASITQQEIKPDEKLKLPVASYSEAIKQGTVVSIKDGAYYIKKERISKANLFKTLYSVHQEATKPNKISFQKVIPSLIVEADKEVSYARLNPVLVSASQAGFENFRLLVVQKGKL